MEHIESWGMVAALRRLPAPVHEALHAVSHPERYAARATIFLEGEPTAGWYLVVRGTVKISRYSLDGREHIVHLVRAGDTFNDVAVLDGGPNPATAVAYTETDVVCISRDDLHRIATEFPELAWILAGKVAERARFLVEQVQDLSMRQVRGRLARLLLEEAAANDAPLVDHIFTQDDMAARLGTVREVVGRSLRALAAEEIIDCDRHRITILDWERLEAEAQI